MSTLENGIYDSEREGMVAVRDGRYQMTLVHRPDPSWPLLHELPTDTSEWTRVADLPDLRMAQPTQIGYPVMAGCCGRTKPRLHVRIVDDEADTRGTQVLWACGQCIDGWADLIDPRDLTPDEIAEHDLWAGGAS